jgi:hypothetical protein
VQKLIPILIRQQGVVPVRQDCVPVEADPAHLLPCKLGAVRILAGVEGAIHRQASADASFSDETQDGRVVCEGLTSPLLADLGEETVLDGISIWRHRQR